MSKYGTFTNLDDLKDWFETLSSQYDTTQWILYHGHVMKAGSGNRNAEQKEENMSFEDSWNLLESWIEKQTRNGGNFTVYIITGKGTLGQRAFLTIPGGNSPGMGGIYGPEYVNKEIENFKSQFLLQQQIEELRAEMLTKRNPLERIAEQLMDSGVVAQVIQGFAMKQMGLNGIPGMKGEGAADQGEGGQYSPQQITTLENSLERLGQHFPNLDRVLSKLANFVDSDPETAKNLLNNLSDDSQTSYQ